MKFPLLCKLEELTRLDEPTSGESNVENCLPSPLAISQLNVMLGDRETALSKAPGSAREGHTRTHCSQVSTHSNHNAIRRAAAVENRGLTPGLLSWIGGLNISLKGHSEALVSYPASRSLLPWPSLTFPGCPLVSRKETCTQEDKERGGSFMCRVHSGSLTIFHCPQTLVVGLTFHPAQVSVNRDLPLPTIDVMEVYT